MRPDPPPAADHVRPPQAGCFLRYEIYHASFRELLNGSPGDGPGSPDGQGYELVALVGELGQAAMAAHGRISDAYLHCFGGLDAGLPVLTGDPGADGGYPLGHLASHLCAAGRAGELHALLAAEQSVDSDRAVNTWFAAHDLAATVTSYLWPTWPGPVPWETRVRLVQDGSDRHHPGNPMVDVHKITAGLQLDASQAKGFANLLQELADDCTPDQLAPSPTKSARPLAGCRTDGRSAPITR